MEVLRKLSIFLSRKEKRHIFLICVMLTANALIDTIGVVSIFPFLSVASNPEVIYSNKKLNILYEYFNFVSTTRFLIALGSGVLFILIISNLLRCLNTWTIYYYSLMKRHNVSKSLFRSYLYGAYTFFLNRNSAELTAHLLTNVNSAVSGVMIQCLQLFANIMVSLFVIILLVLINPKLAIILSSVFGSFYAILYMINRKRLENSGKKLVETNTLLYKILAESFGGIKEIKIRNREDVFVKKYSKASKQYMRCYALQQALSLFPHYAFEILAFGGILIITIFLIATNDNFKQVIPIIGIYAFAARRIIPAFQAIFQCLSQIRISTMSLEVVYKDFVNRKINEEIVNQDSNNLLPVNKVVELKKIKYTYPGAKKSALSDVNLVVKAGTANGIVGVTGAGKSTVIDVLMGLLTPDSGEIIIDETKVDNQNIKQWQANIGYVPQKIFISDDTICRNIAFGVEDDDIDMNQVKMAAKLANVHNFIQNELKDRYKTMVGENGIRLSGGERQRLGIARALYNSPSVIILDEATSALDSITENVIMEAIHNLSGKKTILIIAHRLSTVKQCDMIFMFKNGILIGKGKYKELEQNNIVFKQMARAFAG